MNVQVHHPRRFRRSRAVSLIVALSSAAALAACGGSSDGSAGDPDQYVVGSILSLSGPLAPLGESFQKTQDLYAETFGEAAGVPVKFVTCDDSSTPQGAASCARRLIDRDNVDIVIGPHVGLTYSGAEPLLAKAPLVVSVSPYVTPKAGSSIVTTASSSQAHTESTLEFVKDQGWTNVGVLATTDATGEAGVQEQEALAGDLGLTIDTQRMDLTDESASSQLSALKSKNVDVVVLWMTGRPTGVAFKAIKELGMDMPVVVLQSNLSAGFLESVEPVLPADVYVSAYAGIDPALAGDADQRQRVEDWIAAYTEKYGVEPDGTSRFILDALQLSYDTLAATDGQRDEFAGYVHGLSATPLYNLPVTFNEDDTIGGDVEAMRVFKLTGAGLEPS